jgi:hypothetical protein
MEEWRLLGTRKLPKEHHLLIRSMNSSSDKFDWNIELDIMTPEEVAQYLRKSVSWVYKNWQDLGGRKLKGSLFFPNKEDLYERLFHSEEGVEVRLHPKRNQVHGVMVQNKNRSQERRIQKEGGGEESESRREDPDRHGLLGASQ